MKGRSLAHYHIDELCKAAEKEEWKRLRSVDVLWCKGTMNWRSLAVIGFPGYICYENGTLYKVFPENVGTEHPEFERVIPFNSGDYRRPTVRLKKITYSGRGKPMKVQQVTKLGILVALLFCEKPEGSRQVGYMDKDPYHLHASNLYWK